MGKNDWFDYCKRLMEGVLKKYRTNEIYSLIIKKDGILMRDKLMQRVVPEIFKDRLKEEKGKEDRKRFLKKYQDKKKRLL